MDENKKRNLDRYLDTIINFSFLAIIIVGAVGNIIGLLLGKDLFGMEIVIPCIFFLWIYRYSGKIYAEKLSFLSPRYYYITMFFAYLSVFLGSFLNFYEKFSWWDTMLHFSSGILLGLLSVTIVATLITKSFDKIDSKTDIIIIVVVGMLMSISYAVFWEFYEFSFDFLADGNMQRGLILDLNASVESQIMPHVRPSGRYVDPAITDTMGDMFLATAGALIAGFYAYTHMIRNLKGTFKNETKDK